MTDVSRGAPVLFDGERLTLAREYRGLRKVELAEKVQVTPGAISQYESGIARPGADVLNRLALALGVSSRFFEAGRRSHRLGQEQFHFRRLRTFKKKDRDRVIAFVRLLAEVVSIVEDYIELPDVAIPQNLLVDSGDFEAIERVAEHMRTSWDLGSGPISNVVGLLESRGCIVSRIRADAAEIDAFSCWVGSRPFVLLNADKGDSARSRFDAAHELGHLLVHHDPDPANMAHERDAHRFASAFLLPREQIRRELPFGLDWPSYVDLKYRWKTSIQALLRRALDVGHLDEATYKRAMLQVSQRGWRTAEPGDVGLPEGPSLIHRAVEMMREQFNVSEDRLADAIRLSANDVLDLVGEAPFEKPRLRMVTGHAAELMA